MATASSRATLTTSTTPWPRTCWRQPLLSADVAGQTFNIATGHRFNLNETVELLRPLTGYTGNVEYAPERAGDIKHSLADISRAQENLKYQPLVDFKEGLRRTVEWYRTSETAKQRELTASR